MYQKPKHDKIFTKITQEKIREEKISIAYQTEPKCLEIVKQKEH